MYKSKFIQVYQSLSKKEYKLLQKWVQSPMHNQHQQVIKLFDYLASRTKLTKTTLEKKRIYKHLFPEEEYDDLRLRHIQSYALEVLESFVGYNQVFLNEILWKKNLSQSYRLRQLPQLSKKVLEKAQEQLEASALKNSSFHLESYQLQVEQFQLGSTERRTEANNLPQLFEHLSQFFVVETLKYACTAATHRNVFKIEYSIPFLEECVAFAQTEKASMASKVYYQAYQSLTNQEAEHYQALKEAFFEHIDLFSNEEQYELFQITVNYCIKQINTGNSVYFEEVFELYQNGLTTKILLDKGILSRFTFKNIVSAGLKLGKFDWVQDFIENYSNCLPKAFQATYRHYNTTKLYFMRGDYKAAQQLLLQVEDYDDLFLTLDAKMLLVKIYYEEGSIDALMALIASFKVFLQRKEVMGYHKQVYKNILRLVNKFLSTVPNDKKARKQLKEEILSTEPLAEQQWLLEQVGKI